ALLRDRVRETVGLPEGEEVEVEIVSGKRWFGFAHYLGGFRTRILVTVDLPFPASELLWFCAHEAYPGHHTHRAWQEAELVRRGRVEAAMDVLWSPEAVLAEGIAETGPELVLDADAHEVLAERLRSLGFEYDAEVGACVSAARRLLFPVASNVALLLHDRGATREEAREYAARWSLQPPGRVEKMLANVEARESPGYVHTYPEGRRLVHRVADPDIPAAAEPAAMFPEQWWGLVVFTCFGAVRGTEVVAPRFQQPQPPPEAEAVLDGIDFPPRSLGGHRTRPGFRGAKRALVSACADHELLHDVLHSRDDFDTRYRRLRE